MTCVDTLGFGSLITLFSAKGIFQHGHCCRFAGHRIRAIIQNWIGGKYQNKKESLKKDEYKQAVDEFDIRQKEQQFLRKALSDLPLFASLNEYSDEGGCYEEG